MLPGSRSTHHTVPCHPPPHCLKPCFHFHKITKPCPGCNIVHALLSAQYHALPMYVESQFLTELHQHSYHTIAKHFKQCCFPLAVKYHEPTVSLFSGRRAVRTTTTTIMHHHLIIAMLLSLHYHHYQIRDLWNYQQEAYQSQMYNFPSCH